MLEILIISALGAACITLLIRKRCRKIIMRDTQKMRILALIFVGTAFASAALAQTEENKPPAPQDLALEWANFTEEGIVFSIKNEGDIGITGRLETVFEWLQCGGAETCKRTKNVFTLVREENIPKGERLVLESKNIAELQLWIQNKPFGVDKVRVEIDPANKIKEEREDNNAWEEAPISPRTSGERLAKRDESLKGSSGEIKILPGNKLYILKDIWRNVWITLTFGKEKKIQKRLELIRERLVEIQKLAELDNKKEIPRVLAKVLKEWEKVKEKMRPEQAVQEGLKIQLMLEDIETNVARVSTEPVQKELLTGIGENISALTSEESKKQAIQEGLREQNKSPFFSIRQIKILRLLEGLLPEEGSVQELEKEITETLGLRLLYLPEDIRSVREEYEANVYKNKDEVPSEKEEAPEEAPKEKQLPKAVPKDSSASLDSEKQKDADKKEEPKEEKVVCTAEYNPVCGEDDVTYSNACVAEEQNKVKVAEKGECKLPKPDLYIQKTEILPENPRENDYLSIRANVTNDGGTVQKLFKTRMRIDADINGIYDVIPNEYPLNLLRTSSSRAIAWENVWEAKEGIHRIELCVDSGRAIAELNEENNCTLLAFEVGSRPTSTTVISTSTNETATTTEE